MWIPKSLKLRRFLSHENSTFVFGEGKATLIVGINEDDRGQESNGSGKSAIIEGIVVALTGDSFRKVLIGDIIMNDETFGEVSYEQYNTVSKETMLIYRKFYAAKGKSSEVTISINDVEKKLPDTNEKNKFIINKLGISKEDLINYFIVSKDKYTSFFHTGDTKKKEIVARFSGADLLKGIDDLIKADIDVIKAKIINLEKEKVAIESRMEVYSEEVDELENFDFSADQQKRIKAIEEDNDEVKEISNRCERQLKEIVEKISISEGKINPIKKQIDSFKSLDYTKELNTLNESLKMIKDERKGTQGELEEAEDLYAEAIRKVKGSVQCPKCKFEFSLSDESIDIAATKEVIAEVKEFIEELEGKIENYRKSAEKDQKSIEDYQEKIRQHEQTKTRLLKDKNEIERILYSLQTDKLQREKQIEINKQSIQQNLAKIKLIKEEKEDDDKMQGLLEKIGKCSEEIDVVAKKITVEQDNAFELEQWIYNFKKFHSHLANNAIKSIESFTNYYLERIDSNLNIYLDGFKVKADGKLKENITTNVLRNGVNCGLFDKFSGGERVRIDICCILALQKLINLNSESGGLDLLALDEIIESVDGLGAENIINALNGLNQTIQVITHTNLGSNYPNVVKVRKKHSISEIL